MQEPKFYIFVRPILNGLFRVLFFPRVYGAEKIPKEGRIVLAGNHTHPIDCISVACATKRCVHFLAKHELVHGKLRVAFRNLGIIPVNRETKDSNALASAEEVLRDDKVIGIFPEGRVNHTEELLLPFKFGAVKMAHDTNSKIIPFAITGRYWPFGRNIRIYFMDPIEVTDDLEASNEKLRNTVLAKLNEVGFKNRRVVKK